MPRYVKRTLGNKCTVCNHADRPRIDLAIASGVAKRVIAQRFGISPDATWRHSRDHLTPELKAALALKLVARQRDISSAVLEEGSSITEQLHAIRGPLFSRFLACVDAGDDRAAAALSARILDSLQISAKLTGELMPAVGTSITNICLSPDYIRLRGDLLAALRPFPEAARAVAAVFRTAGERAAVEMQRSTPRIIEAAEVPPDAA